VLEAGRRGEEVVFEGAPADAARVLTAALEGAMLLSRSYGDRSRFDDAAAHVLKELTRRRARSKRSG
jgi:hypothetical protein